MTGRVFGLATTDRATLENLDDLLQKLEQDVIQFRAHLKLPRIVLAGLRLPVGEALQLTDVDLERTLRAIRDQRGDVLIQLRARP